MHHQPGFCEPEEPSSSQASISSPRQQQQNILKIFAQSLAQALPGDYVHVQGQEPGHELTLSKCSDKGSIKRGNTYTHPAGSTILGPESLFIQVPWVPVAQLPPGTHHTSPQGATFLLPFLLRAFLGWQQWVEPNEGVGTTRRMPCIARTVHKSQSLCEPRPRSQARPGAERRTKPLVSIGPGDSAP